MAVPETSRGSPPQDQDLKPISHPLDERASAGMCPESQNGAVTGGDTDRIAGTVKIVAETCEHAQMSEELLKLEGKPVDASSDIGKYTGRLLIQITISCLFFFVELATGIFTGSIALLADSYHMLADVMALIVAAICFRMAKRPSKSNTYGWVRAEALGGFFNGIFLLTVCFNIFSEAVGRLFHPYLIESPIQVGVVGVLGLVVNLVGLVLLHGQGHGHSHGPAGHGHSHGSNGHGHSHDGHDKETSPKAVRKGHCKEKDDFEDNVVLLQNTTKTGQTRLNRSSTSDSRKLTASGPGIPYAVGMISKLLEDESLTSHAPQLLEQGDTKKAQKAKTNVNIKGIYLHLMSDAVGSIIVIITAVLVYMFPTWSWCPYFDPVLSLLLALMITFSASQLVMQSAAILLMSKPEDLDLDACKEDMSKIRGIVRIDDLNVFCLTGTRLMATANAVFCHPGFFSEIVFTMRKYLHDLGIHSLTVDATFMKSCMSQVVLAPVMEGSPSSGSPEESKPISTLSSSDSNSEESI